MKERATDQGAVRPGDFVCINTEYFAQTNGIVDMYVYDSVHDFDNYQNGKWIRVSVDELVFVFAVVSGRGHQDRTLMLCFFNRSNKLCWTEYVESWYRVFSPEDCE